MGVSAETLGASAPEFTAESEGGAVPRALSASARKAFLIWTAVFWGFHLLREDLRGCDPREGAAAA